MPNVVQRSQKVFGSTSQPQVHIAGDRKEGNVKIRVMLVTALTALGSLALFAPQAHASGEVCYDVQVNVQGSSVVSEAGCQPLP